MEQIHKEVRKSELLNSRYRRSQYKFQFPSFTVKHSQEFHRMQFSCDFRKWKTIQSRKVSLFPKFNLISYILAYDYILWFYIPVSNLIFLQVVDCKQHLVHNIRHKFLSFTEMIHQHSTLSIFHQEENMIFVIKVGIKFDDIGMIQPVMNSQLFYQLVLHFVFLNC